MKGGVYTSEITVPSGKGLYWAQSKQVQENYPSRFHIDIIAKKTVEEKDIYLGYAVIRVTKHDNSGNDPNAQHKYYEYIPAVIRAVEFPMLNGQYQDVTLEQVNALIKKAKE